MGARRVEDRSIGLSQVEGLDGHPVVGKYRGDEARLTTSADRDLPASCRPVDVGIRNDEGSRRMGDEVVDDGVERGLPVVILFAHDDRRAPLEL